MSDERTPAEPEVMEPTFWRKHGWTARVNEPHALLSAIDDAGATVAKHRVSVNFKSNRDVANAWVRDGFPEP